MSLQKIDILSNKLHIRQKFNVVNPFYCKL